MAAHVSRRARSSLPSTALGGGLAIGINPFRSIAVVRADDDPPEITPWVVIRPDDTVVVRIARSEMGQGSLTGLAQLVVAEELECDWNKVTWEFPTPAANLARNRVWGDFDTGGSYSICGSQEILRKAGAAARMMLVQAAASGWNVPAAECTVDKGVNLAQASGRQTTYGKVAALRRGSTCPKDVALKDPKDWKIIGKPLKRLDTADKLTGKQVYGADLKLPGMLNATIKACPVFGGRVKSIDSSVGRAHARREEDRARRRLRRRRRRRYVVARQRRARRRSRRMGRGRERRRLERVDRCNAARRARRAAGIRPRTSAAIRRLPSPAPRSASRRSTTIRSRTTRAWNR